MTSGRPDATGQQIGAGCARYLECANSNDEFFALTGWPI